MQVSLDNSLRLPNDVKVWFMINVVENYAMYSLAIIIV